MFALRMEAVNGSDACRRSQHCDILLITNLRTYTLAPSSVVVWMIIGQRPQRLNFNQLGIQQKLEPTLAKHAHTAQTRYPHLSNFTLQLTNTKYMS